MTVGVKKQMDPVKQNYSLAAWPVITVLVPVNRPFPRLTDFKTVYMTFFMHILRQNETIANKIIIIKGTSILHSYTVAQGEVVLEYIKSKLSVFVLKFAFYPKISHLSFHKKQPDWGCGKMI